MCSSSIEKSTFICFHLAGLCEHIYSSLIPFFYFSVVPLFLQLPVSTQRQISELPLPSATLSLEVKSKTWLLAVTWSMWSWSQWASFLTDSALLREVMTWSCYSLKTSQSLLSQAGLHGKGCLGWQMVLSDSGDEHRQEVHSVRQLVKLTNNTAKWFRFWLKSRYRLDWFNWEHMVKKRSDIWLLYFIN